MHGLRVHGRLDSSVEVFLAFPECDTACDRAGIIAFNEEKCAEESWLLLISSLDAAVVIGNQCLAVLWPNCDMGHAGYRAICRSWNFAASHTLACQLPPEVGTAQAWDVLMRCAQLAPQLQAPPKHRGALTETAKHDAKISDAVG